MNIPFRQGDGLPTSLLLSYSDIRGGAARAAQRLHVALRRAGAESRMLVQNKAGDDPDVIGSTGALQRRWATVRPYVDFAPARLFRRGAGVPYSVGWLPSGQVGRIGMLSADILHLHWVAGGMLSVGDVARLPGPLVWTLHDMWAFTGGCHYDGGCGRFVSGCGPCPVLGSTFAHDLSRWSWGRKKRLLRRDDLVIVAPSRWLAAEAARSAVLATHDIRVIPNALDTALFKPVDREAARRVLGLPVDRPIVMFAAMNATGDGRKGFRHLDHALRRLAESGTRPLALIAGSDGPAGAQAVPLEARYLGTIEDEALLAAAYCAADVFVAPSEQENLSNAVVEAMACGTPCIAFRVGGMPDLIDHGENGFLAEPLVAADLARCIGELLDATPTLRHILGVRAREKIVGMCEEGAVARRHLALYAELKDQQTKERPR